MKERRNVKRTYDFKMSILLFGSAAVVFALSDQAWAQTAEWTAYNTSNSGLPYNGATVLAIDPQDNVWIGTGRWYALAGGGLAKFDGEGWAIYNTANSPLPHNDHTGLAIDPEGSIWSGTEGGLAKFDGAIWTVYTTSNSGLPVNLVATPVFDAQGNLWVGSWEGGLVKFDGTNWTIYNTANSGLPHNIPWSLAFDDQDRLWIGTSGGGLARFDGTNWTVYNQANSPLPNNTIWSIAFDSQWNLWVGTDGGGLAGFDGTNWTIYHMGNSGLPSNRIWPIAIDAYDNVWVGTYDRGLAMFDGRRWTVYNTSNSGLPDNALNYLSVDTEGGVWIATQTGGVAVLRLRPTVDFNCDGVVTIEDLLRLIESWGQPDPVADIAPIPFGDGIVDEADLQVLMSYWGQEVVDPTLIAHWGLDETEGTVAAESVVGNDGVVTGVPLWRADGGHVGGALELDGACSVVTEFVLDPSDGPFSVFAWVQGGAPGQVLISQVDGADWLAIDAAQGTLTTALAPAAGRKAIPPLVSEAVITDDNWHRVAFVWDGITRALYGDDALVAEDTQSSLASCTGGLNIGCGKDMGPSTFFSGLIDDVRVYSRAVQP